MNMRQASLLLAVLLAGLLQASNPQDVTNVPCDNVAAIAHMARAKSLAALAAAKRSAGTSYGAELVFGGRSFELQPKSKSAAIALLKLIPRDDEQQLVLVTLGESLCDGESVAEMMAQSRIGERLSRDLSKAVLLAPEMLPKYVAYASMSVHDPHSDYAVEMQAVCRAKHPEFLKAVDGLSPDQRNWFVKHIFDPHGCHALALPEAE
jgi:hypothetical protein